VVQASSNGGSTEAKAATPPVSATVGRVVSPFSLAGVQRQVKVGAPGDSAEHEANRVSDHVTGGSPASKPTISRLESLQRQMKGDKETPVQREAKKEDAPAAPAVQRAEPDAKKAEAPPEKVQRAAPEGKTEDAHVQRATAEDKKDTPVQRAAADDKKDTPVQRACCCSEGQADRRPSGTATVLCKFHSEAPSDESVRRKEAGALDAAAAHAISTKDAGVPLRPAVRQALESRMGADFSGVRVHEGPAAQESASAINARAFTHKGDIWLGRGESQDNLGLMAHEATHVVQQGAAVRRAPDAPKHDDEERPVVRRSIWGDITGVAGAVYDKTKGLVDAAGNAIAMGADFFWSLAQKVAPAWVIDIIQGIRSKGIVGFLRDKLSGAFNGIFGGLGSGGGGVIAGVMQTFGKLLGSAHEIIAALGRGDCKPLFDAVSHLGEVLKDMAGEAWEKIKDFFAPIGDFFADLWKKFGAPVVDFLGDVAADIWNDIKALGQKIWDGTQPIRDAVAAAWKWIKDQLGVGDEPEGQNGLLQWVQKKLGEAWDWFKEKLQPIIGPMQAMVDKIKAIIPLDKILNLRQTVHEWLQNVTQMVTNMRKPKDVTQNQDALRAKILPAVKAAIVSLRGKIVSAGAWVSDQIGGIAQTVTGLFGSLKSNPILGKLSGAIQWVQDKISGLATWVQSGVVGLFTTIGNGVAKLADFIEPVLGVLKKIVSVVVNVVKELPGLVLGPVWKAIPACIRDPIKDFIIEKILSQIPIISTFLKVPEIWGKIQKLVMDFLTQVFVNGDLGGAVMTVIRFVLEAAGVNVDLMLSVLAKAAGSLDEIIMHPVQFLSNLAGAVGQGLQKFVSNIGTHLVTGLVNWLTGPLKDLGVEPIKDLSLNSIFGLVLGILGVSEAKIRAKVEKAIGPKALKILEAAWKWIKALITGGLGGLWNEIQSQLSDLGSMILGGITQWITIELVEVAVAKLIKMCNPVGAIIEAIQTIYKAISFFVSKINEILAFVDSVLNSIQKIVAGDLGSAASWIESALARTIPMVLAFFAKWLGIKDPAPTIREIVVKIQGKVEKAMDWLVDKAISIGKSIMSALGLGGKDKDKEEDQDPKWAAGVAGVKKDIEKMKADGLEEKDVRDKFTTWQSTYGFSSLDLNVVGDDFEILGSMSPKNRPVTKENTGLHSGTSADPIPIYWYKPPGAYPGSVKLTDPDDGSKKTVPMVSRTSLNDKYLGAVTVGIYAANEITDGKVVERTSGTDDMRGGNQGKIISLFRRFGYDMGDRGEDADHVKDLGFGGADEFSNLWPLDSGINRRGLQYTNSYMVEYIENRKVEKASVKSLAGKFFKIKGYRYPAPTKLGGRD
jgi:hypothetical protein